MMEYTLFEILVFAGLAYCILDFILAVVFMRCVLPGLKCPMCKHGRPYGTRRH